MANTHLMRASEIGYSDGVKSLLERDDDPNIINNRGQTALIFAS